MILYLLDVKVEHNDIIFAILTIPRINLHYSFLLLAIDHVIGVGFPYHHRKIMTIRVVLITAAWLLAAITTFIVRVTSTVEFAPPFGSYTPSSGPVGSIIVMVSLFMSIGPIVVSNAYLYYIAINTTQNESRCSRLGLHVKKVQ